MARRKHFDTGSGKDPDNDSKSVDMGDIDSLLNNHNDRWTAKKNPKLFQPMPGVAFYGNPKEAKDSDEPEDR